MQNLRTIAALFVCSFLFLSTAACQQREQTPLLEDVWELIATRHYDEELHGLDWAAIKVSFLAQMEGSAGREESLVLADRMLQELGDSHCGVGDFAQIRQNTSPYVFGEASPGIDVRILDGAVLVTAVTNGYPAEQAGIGPGYLLTAIDGVQVSRIADEAPVRPPFNEVNERFYRTQALLWRLYGTAGSSVALDLLDAEDRELSVVLDRRSHGNAVQLAPGLPPARLTHAALELPGGIAYLAFNTFQPDYPGALLESLGRLDVGKPLIIDLRGNNGGSVGATLSLLGQLSRQRFLAFYRQSRGRSEPVHVEAAESVRTGPVAILVDGMSISAAENFAGIAQHAGLATIVGTQTPGQLLWGEGFHLAEDVVAVIPVASIVYPDGSNLEGKGLRPDRTVSLTRAALLAGADPQLEAAIDELNKRKHR